MALKNLFGDLSNEETQQSIEYILSSMLHRMSTCLNPSTTGTLRVEVGNTINANTGTIGGLGSNYDQISAIQQMVAPIRQQIVVS